MKHFTLSNLSFSVLILIAAAACSKKDAVTPPPSNQPPSSTPDPIALFSVTNTDMRAPVKIKFKNNSQHADTYLWEFSDGTTSTEKEPEKVFIEDGTFEVKLTATGAEGKNNAKTSNLIIENAPNIMLINKVSITDARLSGYENSPFEGGSSPDVYVKLSDGRTSRTSGVVNNAPSVSVLSWIIDRPFIPDLNRILSIEVFDKDNLSGDDQMGAVHINPQDYMTVENRYPTEITVSESGITLKLEVSWQFRVP